MLNGNDILAIIKKAAVEAVNEGDPTRVIYGKITGVDEESGKVLGVQIDEDLEFDEEQTELKFDTPREYQKRTVKVKHPIIAELRKLFEEINTSTACREVFSGTYELCKDEGCEDDELMVTLKDFLKEGDPIIITQAQGGQKFTISGRLKNDTGDE